MGRTEQEHVPSNTCQALSAVVDHIMLADRHKDWIGMRGRYSTLMPVARITSPSFAYSVRIRAAKTSGGSPPGSTPNEPNPSRASGVARMPAIAPYNFWNIATAVPAGAARPGPAE